MNHVVASRFSATSAAALALLVPVVAGRLVPDYSHVSQYISELGAMGMPLGGVVSFAGFLPTGVLAGGCLLAAAFGSEPGRVRIGYVLLTSISLAYIGSAFARCDPGCPSEGSLRQQVHNLLGIAEYVGGGAGLLLLSWFSPQVTPRASQGLLALAGIVTLLAFAVMASPQALSWRGLAQRVAETALFGSLLMIGWRLTPVDSREGGRCVPAGRDSMEDRR